MEAMLLIVFLIYKFPKIHSMSYFVTGLDRWFGGAVQKRKVHRELLQSKDALMKSNTRDTGTDVRVMLLETLSAMHNTDESRLTTELADAKVRVVEIKRKATT